MTKKANVGGVNNLASALANAGVVPTTPAADETVIAAPSPSSVDAAIVASAQVDSDIAAVKIVWEHAKTAGVTKEQFLKLLELDPPKLALVQQHKKQVFGSKKQQMDEAAGVVVNANRIATDSKKSKKKTNKNVEKRTLKTSRLINKTIAETIGLRLV